MSSSMPTNNMNLLKKFNPPFAGVLSAGKVHKFPSINSQTTNSCIAAAQVWDGRSGEDRAGVFSLPKEQISLLNPEEIELVLKATFLQAEAKLLKDPDIKQVAQIMGTTATIALDYTYQPQPNEPEKRYVVLANVGDSPLWVMVDGNCTQYAIMHDADNIEEQERVAKEGGTVEDGYFILKVNKSGYISTKFLAMFRALGDEEFCRIGLSHVPSTHTVLIENPKAKVSVIGASDGFTEGGVTEEVILACKEKSPEEIIDCLTTKDLRSYDPEDDDKGIFCLQTSGEGPFCGLICDGHGGERNKGPAKKNPVLNFVFANLPQCFLEKLELAAQAKRNGQDVSKIFPELTMLSSSGATEASSSAPASFCGGGSSSSTSVLNAATNSHVVSPIPSVSSSSSTSFFSGTSEGKTMDFGSTTTTSAFTL